jgi:hypothetical protein
MGKSYRTRRLFDKVSGRTIWNKVTFELSHEETLFFSISQNGSELKALILVTLNIYILFPALFIVNIYITYRKRVISDR